MPLLHKLSVMSFLLGSQAGASQVKQAEHT